MRGRDSIFGRASANELFAPSARKKQKPSPARAQPKINEAEAASDVREREINKPKLLDGIDGDRCFQLEKSGYLAVNKGFYPAEGSPNKQVGRGQRKESTALVLDARPKRLSSA